MDDSHLDGTDAMMSGVLRVRAVGRRRVPDIIARHKPAKFAMVCGLVSCALVVGCGPNQGSLCDEPASVAGFVTAFDQGLENLEADQVLGLRLEALGASSTIDRVLDPDSQVSSDVVGAATALRTLFIEFVRDMEDANWDVDVALASIGTAGVVGEIGRPDTLAKANLVESLIIKRCGLPPIVPVDPDTVDSLPPPSVPSPTATDPPTDTIDERSEARSLGTTIGEIYGLTLDADQVLCLGLALEGVYDVTGSATSPEKYQRQFQSAFDTCEIDFEVPAP
ncbi:MAG: hypothetical protein ACKOQ7_11335 [Actinomycetota bacterium]